MKKRAIAILMTTVMALALLAGCAGQGSGAGSETATGGGSSAGGTPAPDPTAKPNPTIYPEMGQEDWPEDGISYIMFYAGRKGIKEESVDLSKAASVLWAISGDETGYFRQYVDAPETVAAAVEMFEGIRVTGGSDGQVSTAGSAYLAVLDEEGTEIISIEMQNGMAATSDGRFEVTGLASSEIPGLKTEEDWLAYDAARAEEEDAYLAALQLSYPTNIFEVSGKLANDFYQNGEAKDIQCIYIYPPEGNTIAVREREAITKIYEALCSVQVTGEGTASRWDDNEWSMSVVAPANESGFEDEFWLTFRGATLTKDGQAYELDDVMKILDSHNCVPFDVIKERL